MSVIGENRFLDFNQLEQFLASFTPMNSQVSRALHSNCRVIYSPTKLYLTVYILLLLLEIYNAITLLGSLIGHQDAFPLSDECLCDALKVNDCHTHDLLQALYTSP
jgi:hypothetical protein